MPGVVMDNGSRNGSHTNHDKDSMSNGMNGVVYGPDNAYRKVKTGADVQQGPESIAPGNAIHGGQMGDTEKPSSSGAATIPPDIADQIRQLPPEMVHITEGFESLPQLLQRLSQVTHNQLSKKILDLASMPTPVSALNGNGTPSNLSGDDNSVDNIKKKVQLLKFAEETHANWVKALVITQWSRVSEDIGKLVDLKVHVDGQKSHYDWAVHEMSEMKRSLVHARVPNPDLKTAVEVLSTGKASWMPDLGYIERPPLTAQELLKSLQNLNTLLSIRLNLHDYDKIPPRFRNFVIKSGRATFHVEGEFEVDLTIADESPDAQFWFIDFRFLFSPTIGEPPEHLRFMIESKVNAALEKEGLAGCYNFLHELTLTHKITELRRQAVELSRGRWIDTLRVEPLRRALSIQYWVDRYGKDGPKSWIILGVHSGRRKDGHGDPESSSRISIRWFRDSKEVKDVDIPLDLTNLSAEALIRKVVDRHIFHILSKTHSNLRERPLFGNRELSLSFEKLEHGSKEMRLDVQLTQKDHLTVTIEPVTGRFALSPANRLTSQVEWKLNSQPKDPASNANEFIENLRCVTISEEVISRAVSGGWVHVKQPGFQQDDLRTIVPRDTLQLSWFRRHGWGQDWLIGFSASMSGDRWWLVQTTGSLSNITPRNHLQVPLKTVLPTPSYTFLSVLYVFASALIFYHTNLNALRSHNVHFRMHERSSTPTPSSISLPAVVMKMSDILRPSGISTRSGRPWARNSLKMYFQGLDRTSGNSVVSKASPMPADQGALSPDATQTTQNLVGQQETEPSSEAAIIVVEANMTMPIPTGLDLTKQQVDRDIAFHSESGAFAFRLHVRIGDSALPFMEERLRRIEQLVDFIAVAKRHSATLHLQNISLDKLVFSYGGRLAQSKDSNSVVLQDQNLPYVATIDLSSEYKELVLKLESGNPHLRILDRLTSILNNPRQGLNGVVSMMQLTQPLLRGFAHIESSWKQHPELGEVIVLSRTVDWFMILYTVNMSPRPELAANTTQLTRRISIVVRLQHRATQAWWVASRLQEYGTAYNDVDATLQKVWDSGTADSDVNWRGMQHSAMARGDGIEILLSLVDDAIREVAKNPPPATEVSSAAIVSQQHSQSQPQPPPAEQRPAQSRLQPQNRSAQTLAVRPTQQQRNDHQKQQSASQNDFQKQDMIVID